MYDFLVLGSGVAGLTFIKTLVSNGIKPETIGLVEVGNNQPQYNVVKPTTIGHHLKPESRTFTIGGNADYWGQLLALPTKAEWAENESLITYQELIAGTRRALSNVSDSQFDNITNRSMYFYAPRSKLIEKRNILNGISIHSGLYCKKVEKTADGLSEVTCIDADKNVTLLAGKHIIVALGTISTIQFLVNSSLVKNKDMTSISNHPKCTVGIGTGLKDKALLKSVGQTSDDGVFFEAFKSNNTDQSYYRLLPYYGFGKDYHFNLFLANIIKYIRGTNLIPSDLSIVHSAETGNSEVTAHRFRPQTFVKEFFAYISVRAGFKRSTEQYEIRAYTTTERNTKLLISDHSDDYGSTNLILVTNPVIYDDCQIEKLRTFLHEKFQEIELYSAKAINQVIGNNEKLADASHFCGGLSKELFMDDDDTFFRLKSNPQVSVCSLAVLQSYPATNPTAGLMGMATCVANSFVKGKY